MTYTLDSLLQLLKTNDVLAGYREEIREELEETVSVLFEKLPQLHEIVITSEQWNDPGNLEAYWTHGPFFNGFSVFGLHRNNDEKDIGNEHDGLDVKSLHEIFHLLREFFQLAFGQKEWVLRSTREHPGFVHV
jgi:hypothetical protein